MDRRNFLAFIPAISAIPLIGKEIVQKPNKIEIYQPEQVKDYAPVNMGSFDLTRCQLQVVQDGQIVATGWVTEMTMDRADIEIRSEDGYHERLPGMVKTEVRGIITDFKAWT